MVLELPHLTILSNCHFETFDCRELKGMVQWHKFYSKCRENPSSCSVNTARGCIVSLVKCLR
jgi:hypothetical protein